MSVMKTLWRLSGHIYVFPAVLALIMGDLLWGFFNLRTRPDLFRPINDLGFIKWTQTYGLHHLAETFWLFALIALLALLSVNTFVCTTQRVFLLFEHRKRFDGMFQFTLKLSPHLMHYAMLIMLTGYLVSYLSSQTHLCTVLLPGKTLSVPGTSVSMRLDKLDIDYYQGERLVHMEDRALSVMADITVIQDGKEMRGCLGFNRPMLFFPYSIHVIDFAPHTKSGMKRRTYMEVILKKDVGVAFYFSGMVLFTLGLGLYMVQWIKEKVPRGTHSHNYELGMTNCE